MVRMTNLAADIDAITDAALQARGSQKWVDADGSIGAWIAEMDFPMAAPIAAAMADAAEREFYGYPPRGLSRDLRSATASFLTESTGWHVDPRHVAEVSDVIHALALVIERFTTPGSPIVLPTPAYMPFLDLPPAMGRELRQVPLTQDQAGWHIDFDLLDTALDGAGLLVWVNPHNPIGKTYSPIEIEEVSQLVARHRDLRVFADEIHAPILFAGSTHIPYASVSDLAASQAITAVSASKMWNLAGLKCAQLIFSNHRDEVAWARGISRIAVHPSTTGMVASIAAYRHGGPWREQIMAYLADNRLLLDEVVSTRMPDVQMRIPDATYLAFLDCRALGLDESPQAYLQREAKVCYTDGALCGDAGAGFVRANFATPRPVLEQMLERTVTALDKLRTRP